jgi:two-component system phosphate regulon sensor histidine kinase PhoR
MSHFRTRLLIALITLIITVLVGLGILLGQLFKGYYLHSFNERLKKESNLISIYIEDKGGVASFNKGDIDKISHMLNVRATVTDPSGKILFDSGSQNNKNTQELKGIIKKVVQINPEQKNQFEEGNGYDLHYYWKSIIMDNHKEGIIFLSTQSSELKDAYRQIWLILSVSLGAALLVIIFLGFTIAKRYTKPIEAATSVAIELAKGNYRARTTTHQKDETGLLGTSINMLAQNLQEMVKAQEIQRDRLTTLIENIGAGLILIDSRGYINLINKGYIDIFHIKHEEYLDKLYYQVIENEEINFIVAEVFRTEQKISRQLMIPLMIERRYFVIYGVPIIGTNSVWKGVLLVFHDITELKKLEQVRKDFVANVSHELKTPITSIKGFTETLLDGAMENKETLEAFLSIILKESNRLQTLILDLLELSKIEQHGFKLNIQKLDLLHLLNEVIEILKCKAKEKNIKLEITCSRAHVKIEGDLDRLKQVFINLINNAIAYTPKDGEVKVILQEQEDNVRVYVKDTGVGIEKEEIPRIFERFYRVDRARSRNSGGTGLGLAIVKHLVEAHHGNIIVNSAIGKGSEFIIELHKR